MPNERHSVFQFNDPDDDLYKDAYKDPLEEDDAAEQRRVEYEFALATEEKTNAANKSKTDVRDTQSSAMNLFVNYDHTVAMLRKVEGEDWFKQQKDWGDNSIDGAIAAAKQNSGDGVLYGRGGCNRYLVSENDGKVSFIKSKCSSRTNPVTGEHISKEDVAKEIASYGFEPV